MISQIILAIWFILLALLLSLLIREALKKPKLTMGWRKKVKPKREDIWLNQQR